MPLSQEQVSEFDRNGVVVAKAVLSANELQRVIDELSALIDARAGAP